jgi:hypothetical protein
MTPLVVFFSLDARGIVPQDRIRQLGGGDEPYFSRKNYGNVFLVKHHNVAPPKVGAVKIWRDKMAAASAAWDLLTEEEQENWAKDSYALSKNIPGRQTFIHYYLKDLLS